MKKYFIKFLPIEGNKKSALQFIYKEEIYNHFPIFNNKDRDIYTFIMKEEETKGYHVKWKDLKIVKLFLCSRDIQVGDKVILNNNQEVIIRLQKEINLLRDTPAFKVIGEVSPEAIWVTENMEFNELEWSLFGEKEGIVGLEGILKNPEYQEGYKKFYNKFICKIKCPSCGHFH